MKRAPFLFIAFLLSLGTARVLQAACTVSNTSDSGAGSLRAAITSANTNSCGGVIDFSIGSGVQTISPASALPALTQPVTIDGTTQTGFAGSPLIVLSGTNAGAGSNGLHLQGGNSTVRGLVVQNFDADGILIDTAGGNTIAGNFIGTDAAGTAAKGNGSGGIEINDVGNNTIGGSTAADRNVISGNNTKSSDEGILITGSNSSGNTIQGNYIGVDATGAARLRNNDEGILVTNGAHDNLIGGTAAGQGNVLSGNLRGLMLSGNGSDNNTIQGNFIGTDASGTAKIAGNSAGGIVLQTDNNLIGGTMAGARNVISGNDSEGVFCGGGILGITNNTVQGNFIGTDVTGTVAIPNAGSGIEFGDCINSLIGGDTGAAANLISGNTLKGIDINGEAATGITIQGNLIGTDVTGTQPLGNTEDGIIIHAGAHQNAIGGIQTGQGNLIAFNGGNGVAIDGTLTFGEMAIQDGILGNAIFSNVQGGIALSNGGNNDQAAPVLTGADATACSMVVQGTLTSTPNTDFRIEFFSNLSTDAAPQQGRAFLGFAPATTDASGQVAIDTSLPVLVPAGDFLTATATDSSGNTSEFSAAVQTGTGGNPGTLQFSASDYATAAGAGSVTVTVTRSNGKDCPATVDFATSDGSAVAGRDYVATSGTLNWGDLDIAAKTFTVDLLPSNSTTPLTVNLALSNPTGAPLGSPATATITIAASPVASGTLRGGGCDLGESGSAGNATLILFGLGFLFVARRVKEAE